MLLALIRIVDLQIALLELIALKERDAVGAS